MSILDNLRIPMDFKRFAPSDLASADTVAQRFTVQQKCYQKVADDALAATTTTDVFWRPLLPVKILGVTYIPHAALTADATDYATVSVKVSSTVIASMTTQLVAGGGTGDWVDNTPEDLTLSTTAANLLIAAGASVSFVIEKAASGVVVPSGVLQIDFVEQ